MARKVTGREIAVSMKARRPGDPPTLVAGAAKARQILGWKPKFTDLDAIVRTAWNWMLAHPHGYDDKVARGGRDR